ncbi:MAG: hypothetical protein ACE37K_23345 [Planctomycetota bacterium]
MTRSIDTRNPSGDLPSFLGEPEQDREENVTTADSAEFEDHDEEYDDEHVDEVDEAEHDDDGDGDEYDEDEDDDQEDDADDEEGDDEDDSSAYASRRQPNQRRRFDAALTPPGGGAALGLGMLVTLAGFVMTFVPAAGAALTEAGLEPQIVAVLGVAVMALGFGQRRVGMMQQCLEQYENRRNEREDELRDSLAELLQRASAMPETPAEGHELQHVLLSLQRQDQKINNLTKAIKMYGKPLMEIAGQGTELAGSVAQVKTLVEGGAESNRQAVNRLEQQVRSGNGKADLGDLPQKLEKLEVAIAAIGQRLDDSEVRKSLVRLEDASQEVQGAIEQLHKAEATRALGDELQKSLDRATANLNQGIEQLRDGNVAGLETSVKDIQREVSGLATSVAQIQAAVKSGVRVASAGQAQPAPSTQAAQTNAQPAAAAAATGNAPAGNAPAAGGGDAKEGSGGYSTGKRKSGGKNVLGAIAKLKQMKG